MCPEAPIQIWRKTAFVQEKLNSIFVKINIKTHETRSLDRLDEGVRMLYGLLFLIPSSVPACHFS
jgi:hypothetical protein